MEIVYTYLAYTCRYLEQLLLTFLLQILSLTSVCLRPQWVIPASFKCLRFSASLPEKGHRSLLQSDHLLTDVLFIGSPPIPASLSPFPPLYFLRSPPKQTSTTLHPGVEAGFWRNPNYDHVKFWLLLDQMTSYLQNPITSFRLSPSSFFLLYLAVLIFSSLFKLWFPCLQLSPVW